MLANALSMALDDEYRARATYRAVIETYGPVWPFVNIEQAEQRHIAALLPLFQRYGVPMIPDRWSGQITSPASIQEACEAGVAAEIANYQMYDSLLEQVAEPDVRFVFSNLRNASAYHHLPAFQYCAGQSASAPAWAVSSGAGNSPVANHARPSMTNWQMIAGVAAGVGLVWWLTRKKQGVREA
ncbi:MAG: DUF2202 domain-containing protein [Chromatiales bacterium]|nr:DUF2202 domain-containing protein [Chromatiales bacterium]